MRPSAPALEALRERRRRNRTAGIEPFDAFYQAYVTALLAGMGVLLAGSWLGDDPVRTGRDALAHDGAAVLSVLAALAIAAGIRSGARGGPFALEAPEVRHVLLAPVDRGAALRGPAWRQLRFLAGAAGAAGAVAGTLAPHRLPGGMLGWMASGAAFAVATVAVALGLAWCAAGARLHTPAATAVSAALVTGSVLAVDRDAPAPTTVIGRLGVLSLDADVTTPVLATVLVATSLAIGFRLLPGASVERLARRSSLVGELRFAATLRDLRTVMVLRRQLTQELPRNRPWLRVPGIHRLPPVARRDVRALLRMPPARAIRVLASVATGAAVAVALWHGTTALLPVGAIASFLAGLELLEPLAQELDHPHLLDLTPVRRGDVLARHLLVAVVALVACTLAVAATVGVMLRGDVAPGLAALTALAAAPAAVAGAAGSILRDETPGSVAVDELALPPEAVGMRLLYKTCWPPALAAAGYLPILSARSAAAQGAEAVGTAVTTTVLVIAGCAGFAWWIRSRDDLTARWHDVAASGTGG